MATSISLGIVPSGMMSFIFRSMCAICFGSFSSRWAMSRSMSAIARSIRGSSRSGMGGPPASSPAGCDAGSATPLGMAKTLISFVSFLLPHFGQAGVWDGRTRCERKL